MCSMELGLLLLEGPGISRSLLVRALLTGDKSIFHTYIRLLYKEYQKEYQHTEESNQR